MCIECSGRPGTRWQSVHPKQQDLVSDGKKMWKTGRLTEANHILKKKNGKKEDFGLLAVGKVITHIFTSIVMLRFAS